MFPDGRSTTGVGSGAGSGGVWVSVCSGMVSPGVRAAREAAVSGSRMTGLLGVVVGDAQGGRERQRGGHTTQAGVSGLGQLLGGGAACGGEVGGDGESFMDALVHAGRVVGEVECLGEQ